MASKRSRNDESEESGSDHGWSSDGPEYERYVKRIPFSMQFESVLCVEREPMYVVATAIRWNSLCSDALQLLASSYVSYSEGSDEEDLLDGDRDGDLEMVSMHSIHYRITHTRKRDLFMVIVIVIIVILIIITINY